MVPVFLELTFYWGNREENDDGRTNKVCDKSIQQVHLCLVGLGIAEEIRRDSQRRAEFALGQKGECKCKTEKAGQVGKSFLADRTT